VGTGSRTVDWFESHKVKVRGVETSALHWESVSQCFDEAAGFHDVRFQADAGGPLELESWEMVMVATA